MSTSKSSIWVRHSLIYDSITNCIHYYILANSNQNTLLLSYSALSLLWLIIKLFALLKQDLNLLINQTLISFFRFHCALHAYFRGRTSRTFWVKINTPFRKIRHSEGCSEGFCNWRYNFRAYLSFTKLRNVRWRSC
jgi:hypothetical protein